MRASVLLMSSADAADVWLSSTFRLFPASLVLELKCKASDFNISASLCWRQHDHLCTSTPETGLAGTAAERNIVRSSGRMSLTDG